MEFSFTLQQPEELLSDNRTNHCFRWGSRPAASDDE